MAWEEQGSEDDGIVKGDNGTYWNPKEGCVIVGVIDGFMKDACKRWHLKVTGHGFKRVIRQ